jgi:catechol 2,3-dioxygenase-like lactoylglutathione lyase family enzyme
MEQFYTQTLGFEVTRRWDENGIIFIDVGSTTIELIERQDVAQSRTQRGGFDHLALHVDDVDVAYLELVEKDVPTQGEPRNFQSIRIAFFTDPDGNLLELVEDPRKPEKD